MEALAHPKPPISACAAEPLSAAHAAEASDDVLVAQALSGVPGTLDRLAARYRGRLFAFALAMLQHPDNAEDVAQETLVRGFARLRSYRGRGKFRAWLFQIAANLCRDRHRRRAAHFEVALDSLPDLAARSDFPSEVALRTVVFAALGRLPERYRGPVVLHYMEGLTIAETAAALGRTQTSVRVQLWRARTRLARELADFSHQEPR